MFDRFRTLFSGARASADVEATAPTDSGEAPAPPRTGQLLREQAVDQLAEMLGSIPDPDEVLSQAGLSRADLRTLMGDDEIDGALDTRREAVLEVPWRLEPSDSPAAQLITEEMERVYEPLVRGIWSAVPFGYSVTELVYYRREDGRIGLESAIEKPFEWFTPGRDASLVYHDPNSVQGREVDTFYKFILGARNPSHRNPYGEALLSRLYWPWFFRRSSWEFWMQFLERFGTPLLVGKGRDPDKLAKALSQAVQDAVVAVSSETEVEAITTSGDGGAFDKAEERLSARIHRRILGQTLTSGTDGGSGNRALGEVHERVAEKKKNADLRLVGDGLQKAVNALAALNFPTEPAPRFVFEDDAGIDTERAGRDEKLYKLGVRFTEEYFQRNHGLQSDEFEVTDGGGGSQGGPPSGPGLSADPRARGELALAGDASAAQVPTQAAADKLGDELAKQAPSPIPTDEIKAAIEAAESPEELQERLADLAQVDPDADGFQDLVGRALFAAEVFGYEGMDKQEGLPND